MPWRGSGLAALLCPLPSPPRRAVRITLLLVPPQARAEVTLRWSGALEDGTVFQPETEARVVVGDESRGEPWWTPALGSFRRGEACELRVKPSHGYGEEGCPALSVPPGATLRLTVAVVDWVPVDDVSEAKDGSALKRIFTRGGGWERPLEGYECTIDYELRDAAGTAMATHKAYVLTVGAHMPATQAEELRTEAGGAEVGAVLCKMLKGMAKGEEASLTCAAGYVPRTPEEVSGGGALSMHVSLQGWSKVEPVPHTGSSVVRKVVSEPAHEYERPNEGAICRVRPRPVQMRGARTPHTPRPCSSNTRTRRPVPRSPHH